MKIKFQHIAGIVLVLIGLQITISNLDALGNQAQSIGSAVFYVVLGGIFLYLYRQSAAQNWLLIVTIAALGLAMVQILGLVLFDEIYVSSISVLIVGSCLLAIMLVDKNRWLVLIPGFLLIALGISDLARLANAGFPTGGSVFLGTGLAFLILYFLPEKFGKTNWALVPAVLLLAIGVFATYEDVTRVTGYLIPVLLLVAGGAVLVYSIRRPAS